MRASQKKRKLNLNWSRIFKYSFALLLIVIITWGWVALRNPNTLPIKTVTVNGKYQYVDKQELQKIIMPLVHTGFFSLDVHNIQTQAQTVPWVEHVDVRKIWPGKVIIKVFEQKPIAQWNDNGYINEQGKVFYPKQLTYNKPLPQFNAPDKDSDLVFENYKKMQKMLAPLSLEITQLTLSTQHSWLIKLNNGMLVRIGEDNIWRRLQRFVKVYQKVFGADGSEVISVDLRYSNGMAVRWQKNSHSRQS